MYFDEGVYVAYGWYEVGYEGLEFVLELYGLWGAPSDILAKYDRLTCTLMKASMSPTDGMKSGMKGLSLFSSSMDCGVYLVMYWINMTDLRVL